MTDSGNKTALRGAALWFTDDPFSKPAAECYRYESDAIVVISDGFIEQSGPASALLNSLDDSVPVVDYPDGLIMPGFIDCHVHYPQTEIIGAYGAQLIDWLKTYAFPAEQKFDDTNYAKEIARTFLQESLRCGVTTSAVFCTVHPNSVDAFFEESTAIGMRNIAGKVLMDRNAPEALRDTPQRAYDESKALIERWHGRDRSLYCVTPRFAPTSSPEQMAMIGSVWNEHPGTYLQSHVSESAEEIAWVRDLYPERDNYVDIYAHYDQIGERSIFGHGVHLDEAELRLLHDSGTSIAHCPTSNTFLGSGLFNIDKLTDQERPVRLGLASDVGGGTNLSPLVTMAEAYKVARLAGCTLNVFQAFYLTTLGAATALYLDDKLGHLSAGCEADIVVLDLKPTPILDFRQQYADSLEEALFALMMMGDERAIRATWVAGRCVHDREVDGG